MSDSSLLGEERRFSVFKGFRGGHLPSAIGQLSGVFTP